MHRDTYRFYGVDANRVPATYLQADSALAQADSESNQATQHLANHSTYHRGQIAMMLRQLGVKAQGTDVAEFLLADADS